MNVREDKPHVGILQRGLAALGQAGKDS